MIANSNILKKMTRGSYTMLLLKNEKINKFKKIDTYFHILGVMLFSPFLIFRANKYKYVVNWSKQ